GGGGPRKGGGGRGGGQERRGGRLRLLGHAGRGTVGGPVGAARPDPARRAGSPHNRHRQRPFGRPGGRSCLGGLLAVPGPTHQDLRRLGWTGRGADHSGGGNETPEAARVSAASHVSYREAGSRTHGGGVSFL